MGERFAYLDSPSPIAMAHRGGAAEAPENTWAAFSRAIEDLGYRYIETDVHATSDGVVAVIHDPTLDRTTDHHGRVVEMPWARVATARIAGDHAIPRLDEVLAAWPEVRWNIDAKTNTAVGPLIGTLQRCGAIDRVCVASSAERRLRRFRSALGPTLCTSTGPLGVAALRAAGYLPAALGADLVNRIASHGGFGGAVQVPPTHGPIPILDRRFVRAVQRCGLVVHAWTINDETSMDELLDIGVDGIMTDRPALLRKVLERRGSWS